MQYFSLQLIHSAPVRGEIVDWCFQPHSRSVLELTKSGTEKIYELVHEEDQQRVVDLRKKFGLFNSIIYIQRDEGQMLFLLDSERVYTDEGVKIIKPATQRITAAVFWKSMRGEYLIVGLATGMITFIELSSCACVKSIRIVSTPITDLKIVKTAIGFQLIVVAQHNEEKEVMHLVLQKQNKSIFDVNNTFVPTLIELSNQVQINGNEIVCYNEREKEVNTYTVDTDRYVHSYTFDLGKIDVNPISFFHTNEMLFIVNKEVRDHIERLFIKAFITSSFLKRDPVMFQELEIPNEKILTLAPNPSFSSYIKTTESLKYLDGMFVCSTDHVFRVDATMSVEEMLQIKFLSSEKSKWILLKPFIQCFGIPPSFFLRVSKKMNITTALELLPFYPKLYESIFMRIIREDADENCWNKLIDFVTKQPANNAEMANNIFKIFAAKSYRFFEDVDNNFVKFIQTNDYYDDYFGVLKLLRDRRYISEILKVGKRRSVDLYCGFVRSFAIIPEIDWIDSATKANPKCAVSICSTPPIFTLLSEHKQFELLVTAIEKEPNFLFVTMLRNLVEKLDETDLNKCLKIVEPGTLYNCICLGNDGIEFELRMINAIILFKQNDETLHRNYKVCSEFLDNMFLHVKADFGEVFEFFMNKENYFAASACLLMYEQYEAAIEILVQNIERFENKDEIILLIMSFSHFLALDDQTVLFDTFLNLSEKYNINDTIFNDVMTSQFKNNTIFVSTYFLNLTFQNPPLYSSLLLKTSPELLTKMNVEFFKKKNVLIHIEAELEADLVVNLSPSMKIPVSATKKFVDNVQTVVVWCPCLHSFTVDALKRGITDLKAKHPDDKTVNLAAEYIDKFIGQNGKKVGMKVICPECLQTIF
ncbi:hypothetical protein EIN_254740 [Entamoeba invadens IP1]|uniref:Uncharacterized protein n=1 Tax=Entamoeba invadens IP1 TaxID=370355 RepID=A0A0A1UEW0_ENTIV|nr:hypothetical protein EIN_254740 [Entamoeba invadens IP1]ELP95110.1 hypothetical protein EIN_254740 [Entamoeba invadens IP1]|eukprot:XP_004261881.1 hypothetical protein EIN_254740 [Entamoeba invadens IP1]